MATTIAGESYLGETPRPPPKGDCPLWKPPWGTEYCEKLLYRTVVDHGSE